MERIYQIINSGGSNGGLLMGGVITLRPDLNPLLDMINFHKFSVGYIWKTEYGDPDVLS